MLVGVSRPVPGFSEGQSPLVRHMVLEGGAVFAGDDPTLVSLVTHPVEKLLTLTVTGTYPAVTWFGFILLGMAVGRMQLTRCTAQVGVVGVGAALTVLGVGVSWLGLWVLGGLDRILAGAPGACEAMVRQAQIFGLDPDLPTDTLWWQLIGGPHTNTFLAWSFRAGLALVFLATVDVASAPWRWFRLQVIAGALLAMAWQRAAGRGPLETAVSVLSKQGTALIVGPEGRRAHAR